MKKSNITYLGIIAFLLGCLIMASYNLYKAEAQIASQKDEINKLKSLPEPVQIPKGPFIVINGEPTETEITGCYNYIYKLIDSNNNIFNFTERVEYRNHPVYSIGDTIK